MKVTLTSNYTTSRAWRFSRTIIGLLDNGKRTVQSRRTRVMGWMALCSVALPIMSALLVQIILSDNLIEMSSIMACFLLAGFINIQTLIIVAKSDKLVQVVSQISCNFLNYWRRTVASTYLEQALPVLIDQII